MNSTGLNSTQRRKIRHDVYERDGKSCFYCESDRELTLDHIIPRSFGGRSYIDNLVTCCRTCNGMRGNRDAFEFLREVMAQ